MIYNFDNTKLCNFFDDVSSLKNCIYNSLINCEETQKHIGLIRDDIAEAEFSYPYVLEY